MKLDNRSLFSSTATPWYKFPLKKIIALLSTKQHPQPSTILRRATPIRIGTFGFCQSATPSSVGIGAYHLETRRHGTNDDRPSEDSIIVAGGVSQSWGALSEWYRRNTSCWLAFEKVSPERMKTRATNCLITSLLTKFWTRNTHGDDGGNGEQQRQKLLYKVYRPICTRFGRLAQSGGGFVATWKAEWLLLAAAVDDWGSSCNCCFAQSFLV